MYVEIGTGILGLVVGYFSGKGLFRSRAARSRREARIGEEGLAYIKGVNYILSDAPDLAIEEFIKAVQINSETVETYLALGNLFRSKGDVDRAIRVHQGIIYRPRIGDNIMLQALYELGLDYKKAGLLDRAIGTFSEVIEKDPNMLQAYIQLEALYEEAKDWEAALQVQEKIAKLRKSEDRNVLAHLMTEHGKSQQEQGQAKEAKRSYHKAISIDPTCVDAYLHFGDLYAEEGDDGKAVAMWKKVMDVAPSMTFLAYDRLEHAFFRMGKVKALEELLRESAADKGAGLVTRLFLAKHLMKKGELDEAAETLSGILGQWPDSRPARQEYIKVLVAQDKKEEALTEYEKMMQSLSIVDHYYQCKMCGYRSPQMLWKCPQCQRWDTMWSAADGFSDAGEH
jgi:lipopolysaccharide biosynthesis regulator YciM